MAKKYTNNRRNEKNSSNDLLGISLIIVSAFFLLCLIIPIILGSISQAIRGVVMGLFGFFAYPMFLAILLLGIAMVLDRKISLSVKYIVCIAVITFCAVMILQLATSFMYIGSGFSAYIADVFNAKLTAGGVFFGILAYGMQAALTQVFTYILLSLGIVVSVAVMVDVFRKFKNEKVHKVPDQKPPKPVFVKSDAPPRMVKPVVDNSLFVGTIEKKNTSNVTTQGGSFSQMQPSTLQSPMGGSYNDKPLFQPYKTYDNPASVGNYQHHEPYSDMSEKKLYDSYDNDNKKKTAHEILFENNFSQYPNYTPLSGETSSKIGGDYSDLKSDYQSVISTPVVGISEPEVKKAVKPPKIVHTQSETYPKLEPVVYPAPKDFSDKIVGGEIINGDDLSQKLEEELLKKEEPIKDDFATFDFNRKKVEPATFKPIEKAQEEKPLYQAPIMNGDYFSAGKRAQDFKSSRVSDDKSYGDVFHSKATDSLYENVNSPVKAPIEEKEEAQDVAPIVQTPIINGDYNKPRTTLEQLIAEEKAIMNREVAQQNVKTDESEKFGSSDVFAKEETDRDFNDGYFEDIKPEDSKFDDLQQNEDYDRSENDVKEKSSAFNYVDEVEDLSERSFDVEKDNSGYYEEVGYDSEVGGFGSEIKLGSRYGNEVKINSVPSVAPLKPQNQLKIEDVLAIKPEDKPKPKPKKKHTRYVPPPAELLVCNSTDPTIFSGDSEEKAHILESTLESLKLPAKVTAITSGPAVTRYELEMPPGISVRKIDACSQDIEYNLASNGKIRIETPIPGKRAVGIEVPNMEIATVALRDLIECKEFQNASSPVTLAIGKDIAGSNIICNLEKMPHLLIAGATNSGKSACLNSIITSILYKSSPEEVRLILIDPKEVEFRIYKDMPHLLIKDIINETDQAIRAFKWAKGEMDRRYKLLSQYCVRNIQEFNGSSFVKEGMEEKLPRIVIIVDELCELMMSVNRKDLEDRIMSMAQKARAAGIHLILATQRPSVDVITGTIKANLPSRIAFAVASFNDSRTILDQGGAESLLGRGDMLYAPADMPLPKRVQGAYITSEEVASVVAYVKEHNSSDHDDSVEELIMAEEQAAGDVGGGADEDDEFDPLIKDVLRRVIETGQASTSMIQRRFSVGYARASRIIDQMEMHHFIGPLEGSNKPREVFITAEQFREIFGEDL